MSEQQSLQERTEQPTERRKKDSRKKGQVPRSKELNTMLSLLFGAFGLVIMGGSMSVEFVSLFESALSFDREVAFDDEMIAVRFVGLVVSSLLILTPFLAVMMVGSIVGPIVMGGWSFSLSAMAFKLEKISPAKGIKRVFSAKGLLELFKALFKFVILAATTVFLFGVLLDQILSLSNQAPEKAFAEATTILRWSLVILSFTMILIVVFDVPFELWNHNRQLKMTRREVQDELKESEGRPEVKSRIRTLQRELSQRRMMEAMPTADVVITNPTHFAVALKYEGVAGKAPLVLAKGCDLIALKIRSVAIENDIAIFEAPPLARALYASTEIGHEIPENLYLAVAKVLAYIYQLRTADRGEYTTPLDDISIPDEYSGIFADEGVSGDE
ncbi:MAG TPA: flagellar biosynthesis protein FlhB [Halieaceae bacterium]|nr:flagellar biosynthesis protein FlhB [Halieaceae bacterium]